MNIPPSLCLQCRGSKHLCGLAYCPVMVRLNISRISVSNYIEGSSPPSVFVGRIGYPKIAVGPLIPPIKSDTTIYDKIERWSNLDLDTILNYRLSLVRGKIMYNINDANNPDRRLLQLQELAISKEPVDSEMRLENIMTRVYINDNTPPFGPSGNIISFKNSNPKVDQRVEKVWYDRDLKSVDAVLKLYDENIDISSIVKAFSIGVLGIKKRLVPTRWSITAIDDIISKALIKRFRDYNSIDEYYVYTRHVSMNSFVAILIPSIWQFEWIEAWFPNTTWNLSKEVEIIGDHEWYKGINHYAKVGGCYYSARLATAEHLIRLKRRGGALLLREIYPGFNLPIGVWFVREQLREMFKNKPMRFSSMDKAIEYAMNHLTIPYYKWKEKSSILNKREKSILDYL
ncbi:MAG: Nre family DNA repair protein [Candidatus Nitrosocaldaceae archaeon]